VTGLALAFAAGLLSILSPCVLPLVPIVLGAAVTAHPLGALALAVGLALSFTGLGLLLALVGFSLDIDAGMFRLAAAAIMVALGVVLLLPSWQARLAAAGGPVSAWADRHFGSRFASSGSRANLRSAFCSARYGRPASARRSARRRCWPPKATICYG